MTCLAANAVCRGPHGRHIKWKIAAMFGGFLFLQALSTTIDSGEK
jgi:hypothetical protein